MKKITWIWLCAISMLLSSHFAAHAQSVDDTTLQTSVSTKSANTIIASPATQVGRMAGTPLASGTPGLVLDPTTDTPMAIAYNPIDDLYYAATGGNTGRPIQCHDATTGALISSSPVGVDQRGIWWNPNTMQTEANGFGSGGVYTITSSGTCPDGSTLLFAANQPDSQSGGDYDYDNDEIIYFDESAPGVYRVDRATNTTIGTTIITATPAGTNYAEMSIGYTGVTGFEYALFDVVTNSVHLYDLAGAFQATVTISETIRASNSRFLFSYENDLAWVLNGTNNWTSHTIFSFAVGDAPVITCPADIMINTEPGVCTAVSNFAGTATDTEDGNISGDIVATPASGSAFPVGTTAVTLSVTDSDGNTSTCMFNVTVADNEDPVLTCPADIVQSNDIGVCGANVTVPMPTIMDNCPTAGGSPTQESVQSPLTPYNFDAAGLIDTPTTITGPAMASGDVEVTADFTGDHGTASIEQFNLEGPDGSTLLNAGPGVGDCVAATLTFTVGAATWNGWIDTFGPDLTFVLQEDGDVDNLGATCGEYQLTANYLSGSGLINDYTGTDDASGFYPVGDTDVTFTYVDGGGNTATCTMTVTVNDDEDPVITCAGDPAPIFGSATDAPGAAIPDNNPAGVSATIDITDDFDITDLNVDLDITHSWIGDLVVTLTAPDGTTAAAIIDRPGVPATGLGCNNTVNDILVTMDDEATDAIEGPCLTEYNGTFIPTEALSVFDGVSTLGTWTLTIVDNAGGDTGTLNNWTLNYEYIAVSNPLQVVLDANGMATVDVADLLLGFSDNCGVASTTVEVGSPPTPGSITTVFDSNNGGALGGAVLFDITVGPLDITISDLDLNTEDPGAFTVDMFTLVGTYVGNETDPAPWTLAATGSGTASGTVNVPSNAVLDTPVTLLANTTYGVALVFDAAHGHNYSGTGTDPSPGMPTYSNGDLTLSLGAGQNTPFSSAPFNPRIWNGTLNYTTGGGTIAVSSFDVDCSDVGSNTIDVTVTDINGNTSTCTATYEVIDDLDPVLVCMDFTLELGADGTAVLDPFDMIDLTATFEACGIDTAAADLVNFTCDDIGAPIMITLFGADPSGNAASCTAMLTVVDALGPEVTCPADQTVDPGANNQLYEVPDYFGEGLASAVDNCTDPVTVFAQDPAPGTLLGDGTYTVTLTATDEYGNPGVCTFELTVESILGVNDTTLDAGVTMYPNPAQGQVTIANSSNIVLERATMYDVNGKLVNTTDLGGMQGEKTIDISSLAAGVYIVQIESENASIVKRLIKE